MGINWKVRVKNPQWWIEMVAAVLLCIQAVAAVFGYHLQFEDLNANLAAVVMAIFGVLTLLGIVTDHTTSGVGDSERALAYTEPWRDED